MRKIFSRFLGKKIPSSDPSEEGNILEKLHHCSGDDSHLVDLVGIAAAGQIVDGSSQTLQDGAVSLKATQTLCDLIADVASLDGGEDEGVGIACHGEPGNFS